MIKFEEYDERADIERGELEGLVPFFVMCVILLVAFIFYLFTG